MEPLELTQVYSEPKFFIITIKNVSCYPHLHSNSYYIVGITSDGVTMKFKYHGNISLDICRYGQFKATIKDHDPPVSERYGNMMIKAYNLKAIEEYGDNEVSRNSNYGMMNRQATMAFNNYNRKDNEFTREFDCH